MCEKCIDKRIAMLYNNKRYNLIKSGGGIWSYEARQPVFKVLNPAVYPKDEEHICFVMRSAIRTHFCMLNQR